MLSEHEQRTLEALERGLRADDRRLARVLAGPDPWARWRAAGRWMSVAPVVVVVAALAVTGFVLHLSVLGLLFLAWAISGGAAWSVRHSRDRERRAREARHTGRRAGHGEGQ